MRRTRLALAFAFVLGVAALGCGGGSGSNNIADGGLAGDTGIFASDAGIFASCGYPACYLDLLLPCMPEGACVEQTTTMCGATACPTSSTTTPTGMTTSVCFDNGVKMLVDIDMSNPLAVTANGTLKKGSAVCYTTVVGPYSQSTVAPTATVKNAAGTTVATVVTDLTAGTETITCVGGSPVVVPMGCGGRPDGGTSSCTKGICAP
jgi:hypothetical protein